MTSIPLTKGLHAIVNDGDAKRLSHWKWSASKGSRTWYATRSEKKNGKNVGISMHRFLMGEPDGLEVDHRNGNGLDNRRRNLRILTHALNGANRTAANKNNRTSGVVGVSWDAKNKKWFAYINRKGRMHFLGRFTRKLEAMIVRKAAVRDLFAAIKK